MIDWWCYIKIYNILGTCPHPEIEDGTFIADTELLSNNTYAVGTMALLTCNAGFHVSDFFSQRSCTFSCAENGVWIPPLRKCISDDNSKFKIKLRFLFVILPTFVI